MAHKSNIPATMAGKEEISCPTERNFRIIFWALPFYDRLVCLAGLAWVGAESTACKVDIPRDGGRRSNEGVANMAHIAKYGTLPYRYHLGSAWCISKIRSVSQILENHSDLMLCLWKEADSDWVWINPKLLHNFKSLVVCVPSLRVLPVQYSRYKL